MYHFYSWQSDLPNKDNRSFIENCIKKAIKKLKVGFEPTLALTIDRDTQETIGTPDIAGTIFDKIAKADIFYLRYFYHKQQFSKSQVSEP